MAELERELVALGAALDVPDAPFLATRVRAAIEAASRRRRRRLIVVVAALVGIGVVSVPVVADRLGVGGVEVRQERPPSTAAPGPLDFGQRTTLAEARRAVGFEIVVPAELGEPDEVWLDESAITDIVWLAYRPRPGLPEAQSTGYGALVAQFAGSVGEGGVGSKFLGPDSSVEEVELGAGRALWLDGTHHVGWRTPSGEFYVDNLRIADRVLLWERGAVTLRLESALDKDASLRIACSMS